MPGDDVLTMPMARRIEVFTGVGRRRKWSAETKAHIVAESYETSVGEVADRYSLCKTQLFSWRREARGVGFTPIVVEDPVVRPGPDVADSAIEIELAGARVRIGRAAEPGMAVAVIGALRARR